MKTLEDISHEAGVSISTVSRVLNNSGYASKATKDKVRKAAVGYVPNAIAQSMVTGRSETIGILINCTPEYFFMNAFYSKILLGISEVLNQKKYKMLLIMNEGQNDLLELYYNRRVDGYLILGSTQSDVLYHELIQHKVPFVVIGERKKNEDEVHNVDIDNFKFAYDIVKYLINLGHSRIGMISANMSLAFSERVRGYRQALSDSSIEFKESYLEVCEYSIDEEAVNHAKKLMYMPEKVTAIFGANDMIAVSVYKAAEELEFKIPKDISVVGFDDSQIAQYVSPPLTTVWQPSHEKGTRAAQMLLHLLESNPEPESGPELKCFIQFRKSCCPPEYNVI
ncbi:LacI family transcriptional regulator [Enterocloster citroniae]|uniref:LacI family DNA-binding transcriptional regulator n=1 Tax=Enterocloster citroniae TaxID=358743 RepID=UPI001D064B8F|nr:LacI family DNA-binding transcriptional regulator [Enterocloster citroniae]MCB7063805.1 LacI family transcriptional regulator [Enterocloster citroniae]